MRRGLIALGGATITATAVVLWRRRRAAAASRPAVHLGLEDGVSIVLTEADPAVAELLELAGGLRHRLEIGG